MKWAFRSVLLGVLALVPVACDDDDGEGGDDNSDMTSSEEEESAEGEPADGCVDGDQTVPVGETRACQCDDGSASTQTCQSTGEFGVCSCAGW
jgi:hypothetical protein